MLIDGLGLQRNRIKMVLAGFIALLFVLGMWGAYRAVTYRPVDSDKQAYPAIKIGQTTEKQLNDQVGDAYTSFKSNGYTVKSQKTSKSPYKPDLFYINDDGVVAMKEEWYEPSIFYYGEEQFLEDYGSPEYVLYDTRPRDVLTKALLYPTRGLTAFIHEDTQGVSHIQYFTPMPLTKYISTWAPYLGKKEDVRPFQAEPDE